MYWTSIDMIYYERMIYTKACLRGVVAYIIYAAGDSNLILSTIILRNEMKHEVLTCVACSHDTTRQTDLPNNTILVRIAL